jgi:hypothetical protein
MILLTSTADKIQVITGQAVTVSVHASYVDYNGSAITPGRLNTAISTATTTDVVASPGASVQRNVKTLSVRNKHASSAVTVTIQHTDGSTVIELDKRLLGPGASILYDEGQGFVPLSSGLVEAHPWDGKLIAAFNGGDPVHVMRHIQRASNIAPTPTNITTSVARCSSFRPDADITVNTIRFYGVGATTTVYRCAIYRYSDLARLTAELAFSTAANTWGVAGSSLALALSAGVVYFIACSVNATGTTAGVGALGTTVAATTGQIATAPESLPGNLQMSLGYFYGYRFQFAVTTGALPNPAAALAAQAAWTGGMPAFFLDNA